MQWQCLWVNEVIKQLMHKPAQPSVLLINKFYSVTITSAHKHPTPKISRHKHAQQNTFTQSIHGLTVSQCKFRICPVITAGVSDHTWQSEVNDIEGFGWKIGAKWSKTSPVRTTRKSLCPSVVVFVGGVVLLFYACNAESREGSSKTSDQSSINDGRYALG